MDFQEIIYTKEQGIATITLNRPRKLNALSAPMGREIFAALQDARGDGRVKVVVLTGAGRAFSAGANVQDLLDSYQFHSQGLRSDLLPNVYQITDLALNLEKPIIGAINGPCVGGGMELANMCDLRLASEQARFGMVFVRMGEIPSGGGCFTLPRILGLPLALELLWTGRIFEAQEALRLGYVSRVLPQEEILPATMEIAQQLARGPSIAIGVMKRLAYRSLTMAWTEASALHQAASLEVGRSEDAREGPLAWLEKREPLFKGK